MSFKIDTSGLDRLINKLEEIESQEQSIPVTELLNDSFMQSHTQLNSFQEFADQSGFDFTDQASFQAIPEAAMNEYVERVTDFETWEDMLGAAGAEFMKKQLGF